MRCSGLVIIDGIVGLMCKIGCLCSRLGFRIFGVFVIGFVVCYVLMVCSKLTHHAVIN